MTAADPSKAYRQAAVHTESTPEVFIQLYDQVTSLLYSAATAVESRDIEKKTADLNRALTILIQMQGALDFDRGAQVASNLNQFYKLIRKEISEGSVKLDAAKLREAAGHVAELRDVWEQAQALTLRQATNASSARPVPSQISAAESRGWDA